jgi:GAF domain-containing protein
MTPNFKSISEIIDRQGANDHLLEALLSQLQPTITGLRFSADDMVLAANDPGTAPTSRAELVHRGVTCTLESWGEPVADEWLYTLCTLVVDPILNPPQERSFARTLVHARDDVAILRALRDHVAPDADSISLFTIHYTADDIEAVTHEIVVTPEGEHEVRENIQDDDLDAFKADWCDRPDEIEFIEDIERVLDARPVLRFAYNQGMRSIILVPIFDAGRMVSQFNISYREAQTFLPTLRFLYGIIRDQLTVMLQNTRLVHNMQNSTEQLANRLAVLQVISEAAVSLSGLRDESSLLDKTCEMLVTALRLDHSAISLVNPDGSTARVVSEYPNHGAVGTIHDTQQAIHAYLRQTGKTLRLDDVASSTLLDSEIRQILTDLNIRALMVMPLHDTRLGYIGSVSVDIYADNPRNFTDDMQRIAETITSQVGTQLQNIRLLRDTMRHATQMEMVASFSEAIQTTLNVPTLLEVGLINAVQVVPVHHLAFSLYDSGHGVLKNVAWYAEGNDIQVDMDNGPVVDLERSIAGAVWQSRDLIWIDDLLLENEGRVPLSSDMRSVLALPVYSRGAVVGVIELGNRVPNAYNHTDIAIFQQLISQLAVAIENAEMYTQSQQLARSKAQVNEISNRLQQQVDMNHLLELTVSELGQALGARRARIRLSMEDET